MSIYRNASGEPQYMKPVAKYFEQLGVMPSQGKLTVQNIAPGYGITNLYSVILPKIKSDYEKKYKGKQPVILMTSPCYGLYTIQPEDCDLPIVSVKLHEKNGWKLQANDVKAAIEKAEASGERKVAAFYNMNPHNPTGAILDDREMHALANVFKEKDVFIIDDMIYHGTEFDGKQAKPFASIPGMFDQSITLLGLAKAFCSPSIRAAAACGRQEDIEYLKARNSALLGSIGTPTQVALSAALSNDKNNREERGDYFRRNNANYVARKKLMRVLTEGSDKVSITDEERAEYIQLVKKYFSVVDKEAERIVKQGIPGVRIANDAESGYFSLIDFSGLKGKYCG